MLLCSRMASGRAGSSLKVTQPELGVLPGDLSPGFLLPSAPMGTRPSKQTLGMWGGPQEPQVRVPNALPYSADPLCGQK